MLFEIFSNRTSGRKVTLVLVNEFWYLFSVPFFLYDCIKMWDTTHYENQSSNGHLLVRKYDPVRGSTDPNRSVQDQDQQNFENPGPFSRTIEILKISNHFEPIGHRTWWSKDPWSCCSAEASRIGTRRVVPDPFAIIVHPPNSPFSLKWLNRWDVFDDRGKKHLTTSWPRPDGGKIRFSSCLCHYAYHVI